MMAEGWAVGGSRTGLPLDPNGLAPECLGLHGKGLVLCSAPV